MKIPNKCHFQTALAFAAVLLSATAVRAQVINFDVPGGVSGFTNYFGQGAAADSGKNFWNAIVVNGTTSSCKLDDGSTTSPITLTVSSDSVYTAGGQGTQGTPSGLQSPFYDSKPGPKTCTLANVPAGTYNLYLYGINGDNGDCNRGTTFTVGSSSLSTVNTTAAFNTFIQGNDYVVFNNIVVGSGGGSIVFTYQANTSVLVGGVANTIGNFNGLQLVTASGGGGGGPSNIGFSNSYPTVILGGTGENDDWRNAFPAGNGKMGILVWGNPLNERVVFDDRGFNVPGSPLSFGTVSAANLLQIRNDTKSGNWSAATNLAITATTWSGSGVQGNRNPGYEMLITIPSDGTVTNYSRAINFQTGETSVNWTDSRGTWLRRSFVSRNEAPSGDNNGVVVQYLTAPSSGTLTCTVQLTTESGMAFPTNWTFTHNDSTSFLNMRVNYPSGDGSGSAGYEGVTRIVTSGGSTSMTTINGQPALQVTGATSLLLLTRTDEYPINASTTWSGTPLQNQLSSITTNYQTLLSDNTHEAIYNRVTLNLNAPSSDRLLSNETLLANQIANPNTPVIALWERVFAAGRYYTLGANGSNTPNGLNVSPSDLHGLWIADCNSISGFDAYNMDANLNVEIAGLNTGNMPEAMEGFTSIMSSTVAPPSSWQPVSWQAGFTTNATKLLGCRGIVSSGKTPGLSGLKPAPSTYYPYEYDTGETGWLLYPMWEHYLVTGDTNYLQNTLYPMLVAEGNFYEDFCTGPQGVTDSQGHYIFTGVSPENQPASPSTGNGWSLLNNSSFDLAGCRFCLKTLILASNILGQNLSSIPTWQNILNNMPPYMIGGQAYKGSTGNGNTIGALQEWNWSVEPLYDNFAHRHSSALLGVWPFGEITPENDATLYAAAQQTELAKNNGENYTGGGGSPDGFTYEHSAFGWMHSSLICIRQNNAAEVNHKLLFVTSKQFYYNSLMTDHADGLNFVYCPDLCEGLPAVMMNMAVDSVDPTYGVPAGGSGPSLVTGGAVELMQAVPTTLSTGTITGVLTLTQVTVQSLSWNQSAKTVNCTLLNTCGSAQNITLIVRAGISSITSSGSAVSASPLGNIARIVPLAAGVPTNISIVTD